jgi:hypothetical protein
MTLNEIRTVAGALNTWFSPRLGKGDRGDRIVAYHTAFEILNKWRKEKGLPPTMVGEPWMNGVDPITLNDLLEFVEARNAWWVAAVEREDLSHEPE